MLARTPPRRLTLVDAMILVVAIAASLRLVRGVGYQNHLWSFGGLIASVWNFDKAVIAILGPLTFATLALRLRRPRPMRRRLLDQPGAVACVAAGLGLVVSSLFAGLLFLLPIVFPGRFRIWVLESLTNVLERISETAMQLCGFGVVLGWLLLAMSGRWRAEPSGIDRLGRVVGVAWVATRAVDLVWNDWWP